MRMVSSWAEIATAVNWMKAGRKVALATVVSTWGSSPRPAGSQLVVDESGAFEGSVSGGCIESTVITEAQFTISGRKAQLIRLGVSDDQAWDAGLACGGSVEIYVEPAQPFMDVFQQLLRCCEQQQSACLVTDIGSGSKQMIASDADLSELPAAIGETARRVLRAGKSALLDVDGRRCFVHGFAPQPQLIIIGAVHITQSLVPMARLLGYETVVVDPRTAFATTDRFPDARRVSLWPERAFQQVRLHANTALAAVSHAPRLDDPALVYALQSDVFYIGALGSKKTHAARLDRLSRKGFSSRLLARIHGPIGIAIGSVTPEEIALSIMAEITCVRRAQSFSQDGP